MTTLHSLIISISSDDLHCRASSPQIPEQQPTTPAQTPSQDRTLRSMPSVVSWWLSRASQRSHALSSVKPKRETVSQRMKRTLSERKVQTKRRILTATEAAAKSEAQHPSNEPPPNKHSTSEMTSFRRKKEMLTLEELCVRELAGCVTRFSLGALDLLPDHIRQEVGGAFHTCM